MGFIHSSDYRAFRRSMYRWGWAYTAFLAKTACNHPDYRRKAIREILGWFNYQFKDTGSHTGSYTRAKAHSPPNLFSAKIAGGIAGIPGYFNTLAGPLLMLFPGENKCFPLLKIPAATYNFQQERKR